MSNVLSIEQALELLAPQPVRTVQTQDSKYVIWYEGTFRCASRGCSCPTSIKVQGIPYCGIHTIIALCRILDERDGTTSHEHVRFVPQDESR